jgi:hypothetical protein
MAASNLPTVTVSQFTTIVERQFKEGNRRPIFGLGKGGIGKTESIYNLAKSLGIGYIDIRLLLYSEVDLKGIPYPNVEHTATIWLQNDILPRVDRDGEKGILVFDEITSASRSVRTAAYQLLNEHRLGEYVLPEGWMIVCLGNGEEDGGDYQGMEGNFANRCSVFNVTHNLDSWKDWAYKHNVNYLVLAYVSWRPSDLHTYNPDSETEMLFASPRSWAAVSDILNIYGYNKDDEITNLRILANVGSRVGNQFISFCKYKNAAVEPSDIISGKQVREITEQEVLFLTNQGVVTLLSDKIKTDRQNLGQLSTDTVKACANGIRWMIGLKSVEHQVMAIKDLVSTNRETIAQMFLNPEFNKLCPELAQFAQVNKGIFRK